MKNAKKSYWLEFCLALFVTALACVAAAPDLLLAQNNLFPVTADAMGHMTKVQYLVDSLRSGDLSPWFSAWYSGTATSQYYAPLSYVLMTPIQLITNNAMVTYKIFCFGTLFVGGMGTWAFCRRFMGPWCGLFGTALYALQPLFERLLFKLGVMAQAPIFALFPFYMIALVACAKKPTRLNFTSSVLLTALIILGHAMHAYMIGLCIMAVLLVFVFTKQITFRHFLLTGGSIALGAVLTGFWWMVGVTGFENPGIPYVLPEAIDLVTTQWDWFYAKYTASEMILPIAIPLATLLALGLYIYLKRKKRTGEAEDFTLLFSILVTIVTIVFSFGDKLPLFHLIPMSQSLVTGRILTVTVFTGAVTCAYLLQFFLRRKRFWSVSLSLLMFAAIVVQFRSLDIPRVFADPATMTAHFQKMNPGGAFFEKGRYGWVGAADTTENFYAYAQKFNTSEGWNVEGTPHNRTIWNQHIAFPCEDYDYIIKNQLWWNVRYFGVAPTHSAMGPTLLERGFKQIDFREEDGHAIYELEKPSTYYMTDPRNGLLLGESAIAIAPEFPSLVYDSRSLEDFSFAELQRYRFLYLYHPVVESKTQQAAFERIISALVAQGTTVFLEPNVTGHFPLFGVEVKHVLLDSRPKIAMSKENPYDSDLSSFGKTLRKNQFADVLYNLSESYCDLLQFGGRLQSSILGAKELPGGKVIFATGSLSDQLKPMYMQGFGQNAKNPNDQAAAIIFDLLTQIMDQAGMSRNYVPGAFPILQDQWDNHGGSFTYESEEQADMVLSVTYSPRWNIRVDGEALPVYQTEHLIRLLLPPGKHTVTLHYGMTVYGVAGYAVTALGFLALLILLLCFYRLDPWMLRLGGRMSRYLEISPKKGDAPLEKETQ